jgi:hypothetical protein
MWRMNWARRLKRVFGIEIQCCARCGSHLQRIEPGQYCSGLPLGARAPPVQSRLL